MKSKKVIVFGGSGFIGLHLVRELLNRQYQISIFDIKEPESLFKSVNYIKGDILNEKDVNDAIKGHSLVFNFAGWADMEKSIDSPIKVIKQNVLGNTVVLSACVNNSVKRYFFASSIYVFSKSGSFYRASKQSCELIIKEFQKRYNLPFTILRFGSLYGPGAKDGNAIYDLIKMASDKKKIDYWGSGDEIRQYIHVNDAARGCIKSIDDEYENKNVILTGIEKIKTKDLLVMLNEIFDNDLTLNFNPNQRSDFHYKITPYNFLPDIGKNLLLDSFTDMGQGLLECIQQYNINKLSNNIES